MAFKMRPKHHYVWHVARDVLVSRINPRMFHVWSDEKFLGCLKKQLAGVTEAQSKKGQSRDISLPLSSHLAKMARQGYSSGYHLTPFLGVLAPQQLHQIISSTVLGKMGPPSYRKLHQSLHQTVFNCCPTKICEMLAMGKKHIGKRPTKTCKVKPTVKRGISWHHGVCCGAHAAMTWRRPAPEKKQRHASAIGDTGQRLRVGQVDLCLSLDI